MKKYIIVVLTLFFSINLFSQDTLLASSKKNNNGDIIDQNKELAIVNSTLNQNFNLPQNSTQDKGVFLSQIGDANTVDVFIMSNDFDLNFVQLGNDNVIDLDLKAEAVNYNIIQNGSDNLVLDYSFGSESAINTTFTQQGENLTIEKFGSNSLSDGLEIKMTGENRNIIIRSYK